MADTTTVKTKLLDTYYRKIALSQIPNGYSAYFQLGDIQWGYGLVTDDVTPAVIPEIDSGLTELPSVFVTGTATYTYLNGKIIIVAELPRDLLVDGEVYPWSTVGILDNDGELVGVLVVNPQSVTNQFTNTVTLEIDTSDDGTTALSLKV